MLRECTQLEIVVKEKLDRFILLSRQILRDPYMNDVQKKLKIFGRILGKDEDYANDFLINFGILGATDSSDYGKSILAKHLNIIFGFYYSGQKADKTYKTNLQRYSAELDSYIMRADEILRILSGQLQRPIQQQQSNNRQIISRCLSLETELYENLSQFMLNCKEILKQGLTYPIDLINNITNYKPDKFFEALNSNDTNLLAEVLGFRYIRQRSKWNKNYSLELESFIEIVKSYNKLCEKYFPELDYFGYS